MRCAICKKEENEIELFEGILGGGMIRICDPCSITEGIPTIKKPSSKQLEKADERDAIKDNTKKNREIEKASKSNLGEMIKAELLDKKDE